MSTMTLKPQENQWQLSQTCTWREEDPPILVVPNPTFDYILLNQCNSICANVLLREE